MLWPVPIGPGPVGRPAARDVFVTGADMPVPGAGTVPTGVTAGFHVAPGPLKHDDNFVNKCMSFICTFLKYG